jgi:enoyl-CoA hydratase/carnithine racemase
MTAPAAPVVLIEHPADGVALIRLNRPEARNALNMEVRRQLAKHVADATDDPAVRVIIFTGGEKVFAAGADIKEMAEAGSIEMMQRGAFKLWRATAASHKPVIAAVNGFAVGGGCELAMCADIIIAGESARFGQPEVKIGITPGGGGTQRLTRAVGKFNAMRICLTGDMFSAAQMQAMGVVSEVVPDADTEKRALALAQQIAELPPLAVQQIKEIILAGEDGSLEEGLRLEAKAIQLMFSSQDQKEGMAAFIEKRKPKFQGR